MFKVIILWIKLEHLNIWTFNTAMLNFKWRSSPGLKPEWISATLLPGEHMTKLWWNKIIVKQIQIEKFWQFFPPSSNSTSFGVGIKYALDSEVNGNSPRQNRADIDSNAFQMMQWYTWHSALYTSENLFLYVLPRQVWGRRWITQVKLASATNRGWWR